MDKLKSILSSGSKKDDETVHDTGASGKLTGEGSHFGTGGTGTDSAGYSLGKDTEGHGFSAAEPTGNTDSSGYDIAKASETLGTSDEGNHVNTAATPSALGEDDGTGRAAIGETSTYSSHPLSTGDKTSSVIDPTSSDANTFRRPEVSSSSGVGPHAAETAARRAMDPSSAHMPGEYPEDSSNPYAASNIDPRVDSPGHAPIRQSHTGGDTALGAGAGAAGLGASEAVKTHEPTSSTTAAPSTLTSTTNPTERSPAYGSLTESRGLESATPATASTPATTTADEPTQKKGMVGTVLGALGLGGGAAVAKHEHDKNSAVDSSPSTTTGVDSYRTPSQSGPPPAHHRKESIPTTAYPSGNLESVRPSAGPTGQTPTSQSHVGRDAAIGTGGLGAAGFGAHEYEKSREPTSEAGNSTFASGMAGTSSAAPNTSTVHDLVTGSTPQTSQSTADDSHHYGRDAAIGGGALSAAGLGAHEYEKSRASAHSSDVTPSGQQYGNQSTGAPQTSQLDSHNQESEAAAPGVSSGVTPTSQQYGNQPIDSAQTTQSTGEDSHHYGRDAAIGGGAVGAAALGAHEYEKNKESTASTSGGTPSSQQYGNQPTAGQENTKSFPDQVDPRTDAAGNPRSGAGVGAVATGTSSQPEEHHYGRDAAMVGGGAAATGVAAHEFSEHDAGKAEKEHAKLQKQQTKEIEKEEHAQEKEAKKEEKAHEKEIKKEQKAEEKAEKKHEKMLAKEEKKEEKIAAKEEKKHEKEVAKEEKKEEKLAAKEEKRHHEEEGAAAVGAGALATGAYEAEKHHETSTSGGGLAAADAADAEAYNKKTRYTAGMADPGADPTVRQPSLVSGGGTAGVGAVGAGAYEAEHHGQGTTTGTQGSDPYYNRQQVPDSAIAGQQSGATVPTDSEHHYGRDAAVGTAGAGALGAGAYEAEHHGQGTTTGTQGSDPYYNRQQVPDSAIAGQQSGATVPTDSEHHYGRDAAVGTAGAGALGAGAYEAENHGQSTIEGTHGSDPYYNRHQLPDSAIADQPTGSAATDSQHHDHSMGHKSGLAAADEDDRRVYGKSSHEKEKKPSLFRRIFKRKKNVHTGESEDDEDNYEDVPHDHHDSTLDQGTTSGSGTPATATGHTEGELTKPSYNPFKKEDPNVRAVEGRI